MKALDDIKYHRFKETLVSRYFLLHNNVQFQKQVKTIVDRFDSILNEYSEQQLNGNQQYKQQLQQDLFQKSSYQNETIKIIDIYTNYLDEVSISNKKVIDQIRETKFLNYINYWLLLGARESKEHNKQIQYFNDLITQPKKVDVRFITTTLLDQYFNTQKFDKVDMTIKNKQIIYMYLTLQKDTLGDNYVKFNEKLLQMTQSLQFQEFLTKIQDLDEISQSEIRTFRQDLQKECQDKHQKIISQIIKIFNGMNKQIDEKIAEVQFQELMKTITVNYDDSDVVMYYQLWWIYKDSYAFLNSCLRQFNIQSTSDIIQASSIHKQEYTISSKRKLQLNSTNYRSVEESSDIF